MGKIIFICTGNTCRSPMAEAIGKDLAKKRGLELEILSRGIAVWDSAPAHPNAIKVMRQYNLDLSDHISKQITPQDMKENSLILTMTRNHKAAVSQILESRNSEIYTIREFIKMDGDIPDPYGGDIEIYKICAEEIYHTVKKALDHIAGLENK